MKRRDVFTIDEVKRLVQHAYEVGYCDGECDKYPEGKEYKNAKDFWENNSEKWVSQEINLV